MTFVKKNTFHLAISFVVVGIVFLVISNFIVVPYRLGSYAEVFPKEKWLLTRGNSGQIISNLIDYTAGYTTSYSFSQFERGEFVSANFHQFLKGKKEFEMGDTIVFLQSSYVRDELIKAEGELMVALANLKSQSSAEKEALIREAESRLKYTEERITEQKVLYERLKQLFEKGLASQQEYELEKWNLDLLEIEANIYSAQLDNLTTGVKPEQIKLLQSQVSALQSRLEFLKERESQLVFVSPISGKIVSSYSPDTLLIVMNDEQVVLHMPVKIEDMPDFRKDQLITISFAKLNQSYSGKVLNIDKEVKLITGQQVVFISVLIDNREGHFLPGMILENYLKLGDITLLEQISRAITR
jgi:hypothetical protein